jgi:hypothetical protein
MSATVGKSATESPLRIKKSATVGNLTRRERESAQAKSGQSADLVVARIMSELDLAECLHERRHIHAEAAAIALAEAVPPADRVICRAAPCLGGAFLGRLLFVCRAQVDLVTLLHKPGVKIVEASQLIPQLGGSDLTKQCGRFGSLIRPHGVRRSAGRRPEFPWLVFGSCGHAANSGRSCALRAGRADRFDACDAKHRSGAASGGRYDVCAGTRPRDEALHRRAGWPACHEKQQTCISW